MKKLNRKTEKEKARKAFKNIKGWNGLYKISRDGEVMSFHTYNRKTPRLLKPTVNKSRGYVYISLKKTGQKTINCSLHRLVAKTFLSNPNNYLEVNHKDGNKQNNKLRNLEWVNHSQNELHSYRIGIHKPVRGERGNSKLKSKDVLSIRKMKKDYPTMKNKDIALKFGIGMSTVTHILLRTRWGHI